jgi:hypothetical protein
VVALGRLFTLQYKLVAALADLEVLRFAAEDAVDLRPMMTPAAQHQDVHLRGDAIYNALSEALDILDVIVAQLLQGYPHVS